MKLHITIMNVFFVLVIIGLSMLSFNLYNDKLALEATLLKKNLDAAQKETMTLSSPVLFLSGTVKSFDKDSGTITINDFFNNTKIIKYDATTMFSKKEKMTDAEYKAAIDAYKKSLDESVEMGSTITMPIFPSTLDKLVQIDSSIAVSGMQGKQVSISLREPMSEGAEAFAMGVEIFG